MIELGVFLLSSLGIIYLSRRSITMPYSHGFPRFFAFEALLGLVVLNARSWLIEPFSLPQIISWILLLGATVLAIYSFWALRRYGASDHSIQDVSRISFEKTTRLVTQGPYRWIRHPLYASLIWLAWGIFFKHANLLSGLLALVTSLTLFLTSIYEERENMRIFGDEYITYMQRTKRFIPFLF